MVLGNSEPFLIGLRRYLVEQKIKIYCIQWREKNNDSGMNNHFFSSKEEAEKHIEKVKKELIEKDGDEISEIFVDQLFKWE